MPIEIALLPALLGVLLSPHTHVRLPTPTHRVRGAVSMSEEGDSAAARLAALEQQMQELKIAALEKQMAELQADGAAPTAEQLEALGDGIGALRTEVGGEVAVEEPEAPPPPAAPAVVYTKFPEPDKIGIADQRCIVIFYAYDGIPIAETLLENFEDEAKEIAACGCALVAVRQVRDDGDRRRVEEEYAERFPSINFVAGLDDELTSMRTQLGVDADWKEAVRKLYYEPFVVLVDPDGGMRGRLSHRGLRAPDIVGNVMRELHIAVPRPDANISFAERMATRVSLHNDNIEWAKILEAQPELRQPTRTWFDGIGAAPEDKLLEGVDLAALPGAIDEFIATGAGAPEVPDVVSEEGVQAPAWYARAKYAAEKKQEEEKLLWNGTAPSATPGPFPIGPAGRRLEPMKGYADKALEEAKGSGQNLLTAFFDFRKDEFKSLPTDDAAPAEGAAAGAGDGGGGAAPQVPRNPATESALQRAEMLALGLSRSATSKQNTRRVRLLRELEASVQELEAEGFSDRAKLKELKEQIKTSYATAPPEFIKEARKANMFNEALPPRSIADIASDILDLSQSIGDGFEKAALNIEFDSINPGRKRGPREKGNKIDIGKTPE